LRIEEREKPQDNETIKLKKLSQKQQPQQQQQQQHEEELVEAAEIIYDDELISNRQEEEKKSDNGSIDASVRGRSRAPTNSSGRYTGPIDRSRRLSNMGSGYGESPWAPQQSSGYTPNGHGGRSSSPTHHGNGTERKTIFSDLQTSEDFCDENYHTRGRTEEYVGEQAVRMKTKSEVTIFCRLVASLLIVRSAYRYRSYN